MFRHLFQLFKAVPVTWIFLFVSGLLWAADVAVSRQLHIEYWQAQHLLGAPRILWDAPWWTIFTSTFHHGGIVHLLLNASSLWWIGRLLETRMGSWRYALFSLLGAAVAGGIQSIWGPFVGISGMVCAQFGLAWAWRNSDEWLQTYLPKEILQLCLLLLLAGLPLTWLRIMPIGNASHFAGLIYGYLAGAVYFGSPRAKLWKPVFWLGHLLIIPLFFLAHHPVWNGEYQLLKGELARNRAQRRARFQSAIFWNPQLDRPWVRLIMMSLEEGDLQTAWEYSLRSLQYHPSNRGVIEVARRVWSQFSTRTERESARLRLRQIFGETAPAWEARLLSQVDGELIPLERIMRVLNRLKEKAQEPEKTLPPITLPPSTLEDIRSPERKLPPPDPNSPDSAVEGQAA